jgi:hypothetical protein
MNTWLEQVVVVRIVPRLLLEHQRPEGQQLVQPGITKQVTFAQPGSTGAQLQMVSMPPSRLSAFKLYTYVHPMESSAQGTRQSLTVILQ